MLTGFPVVKILRSQKRIVLFLLRVNLKFIFILPNNKIYIFRFPKSEDRLRFSASFPFVRSANLVPVAVLKAILVVKNHRLNSEPC